MAGMFQFTPPSLGSNSLLYTRYQTLRWFGQHLPQQFDFYSRGVDPASYRSFRGLGILQRVLPQFITSWLTDMVANSRRSTVEALNRGPVPALEKLTVIRSYRFVICYENTSTPGYISEKLFDCLFAGCVPIYLGEPDIQRFIPKGCFIDRQVFANDAELAAFLIRMPYKEYASYLTAIKQFVGGIERQKFGSEANAKRIADVLLADIAISVDN
jgi:hypothetical protein